MNKTSSFKDVLTLLDKFEEATNRLTTTNQELDDLFVEAKRRLRQLDTCLVILRDLQEQIIKMQSPELSPVGILKILQKARSKDKKLDAWFKTTKNVRVENMSFTKTPGFKVNSKLTFYEDHLWMLAEYFYYSSWRLCSILQKFPQLRNFSCEEIRVMRNLIIEHPEHHKIDPILYDSFGYDLINGPRLKTLRRNNQPLPITKEGLFSHADSFIQKIKASLLKAMSQNEISESNQLKKTSN